MAKLRVDLDNLIRLSATKRMREIFLFHISIMFFSLSLQSLLSSYKPILPITFVVFCNTLCLAERIWDVQLRTLVHWPLATQGMFLTSRLTIVTVTVLTLLIWIRLAVIGLKAIVAW